MVPQAPQLFASLDSEVSQPFAEMPSQFAYPPLHFVIMHWPDAHSDSAFGSAQAYPQNPQLFTSVSASTSQPFDLSPSQSKWKPLPQTLTSQSPFAQTAESP